MTRVLLCDDSSGAPRLLDQLSEVAALDGAPPLEISAHPRTAQAAMRALFKVRVDAILIDLFLPVEDVRDPPPASGPWLAQAIASAFAAKNAPCPPLILWTSNPFSTLEGRNRSRAFRHLGGTHVIDKQHPASRQYATLQAALGGATWEPESDVLTDREETILAFIAAGYDRDAIARSLFLDLKTVQSYVTVIRRKLLGVSNDGEQPARGAGPLIAAASAPGSGLSWVPVEYLGPPPEPFSRIQA